MRERDIPELEDLLSVPVAATKYLGVTRQRVFQMLDEGKLTFIRKISGAGKRPAAYVVSKAEVEGLVEAQKRATKAAMDKEHVPVG